MTSLRQLAACIGLSGNISVLRDFFGFLRGKLPPNTGLVPIATLSLLEQARRLRNPHFHLNVIRVGVDNFTDTDGITIDCSIFRIRDIYDQIGVGVGRVRHYAVSVADAGGLDRPTTYSQLEAITHRWHVRNNGIDVFIPHSMWVYADNNNLVLGHSPTGGPCEDKDDKGMNGSVVGLFDTFTTTLVFSHEIGHYLGLDHKDDSPQNLMYPIPLSAGLTNGQGNKIRKHCLVKPGC